MLKPQKLPHSNTKEQFSNVVFNIEIHGEDSSGKQWEQPKKKKRVSEQTSFSFHYFIIQLKISLLIIKKPKNTNHKSYWFIFSIISPCSHKDHTCLRKTLQQRKEKHSNARNILYICISKSLYTEVFVLRWKKNLKIFSRTRSWKEISSIHCIAFSNNRKALLESYIDLSDLKWG